MVKTARGAGKKSRNYTGKDRVCVTRAPSGGATVKKLLLVAHAPSANTRALLAALEAGCASAPGLECLSLPAFTADAAAVRQAAGILLLTPENFGYMSGALKDFFDRVYYPCLEHTQGLPYSLCVRAGQDDGSGSLSSVGRIVTGLRWCEAQPPLVCAGPWREDFRRQATDFAAGFAQGLEMGIF